MAGLFAKLGRRVRESRAALEHRADPVLKRIATKLAAKTAPPALSVCPHAGLLHKYDVVISRAGGAYRIEYSPLGEDQHQLHKVEHHAAAYIYWLLHCPAEIERLSVTISDGDQSSWARFSPSTCLPHQIAIPDPYFFDCSGFDEVRDWAGSHDVPWAERSSRLVWRGVDSGLGAFDPLLGAAASYLAAPRLLLWLAAQEVPDTDIALSAYGRDQMHADALRRYGVLREPVPEQTWIGRKFAIDIDGHTNTWSNLLVRLHYGCCVLKVESRHGYRQWFYDRLHPWEHYVPVRADLADFAERVDWVRSHDAEAAAIAANGRAFAQSLSFAEGLRDAVALIGAHVAGDDPFNPPAPRR